MSSSAVNDDTLFLGIDGGGTKCRSCLVTASGDVIGEGLAGPANPNHGGLNKAIPSITDAAEQALVAAGYTRKDFNRVVVCAALAGVNIPSTFNAMKEWQHPFADWYVTTDLHGACLGAHGGHDGAVIVCGTGSCGFVNVKGRSELFGGHGFHLGDKGSGAWLGLEAVKAVLEAYDGLAPATVLTEAVKSEFGVSGLDIVERLNKASSSEFASLAPSIFAAADSGDAVAISIVQDGASYIDALARKLLAMNPPRFSMIGGISAPLKKWLSVEVAEKVEPPLEQPELGAIHYAKECYSAKTAEMIA
ncbi:Glucosamine kinase GspK [Thalassocella blandensis]|nr:Glucosamine kinase GspK [Thalassocella blandensis]